MQIMFHTSPFECRSSIRSTGLEARRGTMTAEFDNPAGVYLFSSEADALKIARGDVEAWAEGDDYTGIDVWAVEVDETLLLPDPQVPRSFYSESNIPPERLALAHSVPVPVLL